MELYHITYIIKHLLEGLFIRIIGYFYKRDKKVWVFGEWFGEKCGDNCTYLANYVSQYHPDIKVYWIAKENNQLSWLSEGIQILSYDSQDAKRILKKAGYGFVGQDYKDFTLKGLNYLSGAKTVLLWHGIPWKKIGNDSEGHHGFLFSLYKRIYNFAFGYNYILSPSSAFDKVAKSAFGMKENSIIRSGYPRNSMFYNKNEVDRRRDLVLKKVGCIDPSVIIVAYMPTFRHNYIVFDFNEMNKNVEFVNYLESKNILIIQKKHYVDAERNRDIFSSKSNRIVYLNDMDAQSLLCSANILITDYSGCFFDYSLLDRPIIHYIYDYNEYSKNDRGLYYKKEDVVFGSIASNEEELIQALDDNIVNPMLYSQRRNDMRVIYLNYESENSSEQIFDFLYNEQ